MSVCKLFYFVRHGETHWFANLICSFFAVQITFLIGGTICHDKSKANLALVPATMTTQQAVQMINIRKLKGNNIQ